MYTCRYCSFRCIKWLDLLRHSFEAHSSIPNFSFQCDVQGCHQTFKKYSSIQSHLNRKHPNCDLQNIVIHEAYQSEECYDPNADVVDSTAGAHGSSDSDNDEMDLSTSHSNKMVTLEESVALFLITLKEKYKLTQTAVDFCVDQTKTIIGLSLQKVKHKITLNSSMSTDMMTECFDNDEDPFSFLSSEYLQTKFYKEHFGLIVSTRTCTNIYYSRSGIYTTGLFLCVRIACLTWPDYYY